jgi:ubiquinone/menaquinone biosynthesis C-methylase UbiE
MIDRFQNIYANHADQYEAFVSREDYQGNILRALSDIRPLYGLEVVEFGAGTGRLTRLLAPVVKSIRAYDASQAMLDVAEKTLRASGTSNWTLAVGDNRRLPAEDASADLVIEGWSFGHLTGWYPDTWHDEVNLALFEMRRVLRRGGVAILLETQTTGSETPHPPTEGLADLYHFWERDHGFAAKWIRTDYQFASPQEAESLTRFFFGDQLADRVVRENWVILPECTGIWWRTM